MPRYLCDLHTHSWRSDGNDSVTELIDRAAALGMKVLALTDHDIRPPLTLEAEGVAQSPKAYAAQKGLSFIPGIEYSCDTWVDDVHVVGLGCDFTQPAFAKAERDMARSKTTAYRRLTEILTENNIRVSWEDVLNGGPHGRRAEDEVQRKHIFEAIAQKGYTKTWQEAKLLVRDNPAYNVQREKIDPAEAIKIILDAGGIPILAHPYLIDETVYRDGEEPVPRAAYIERLIEAGLMGIEAVYPYYKTSYKGDKTNEQISQEVLYAYRERLPVISGGSDYHADAKKGVENARMIGEAGVEYDYFCANPYFSALIRN